jgi:CRP-like cAMP-binding protein
MTISDQHALMPLITKLTQHSRLDPAEIEAILALPYRMAVSKPNQYIVREGDETAGCAAICSGFAYRSKMAGNGARQILSIHLRGDLVDLQNSLLGEADHSVQALTTVEAAYIPQHAILAVAQAHPGIARALWRDTLVDGSIFREWILNVGRRDARQRISHLLCELTLRQQRIGLCEGPSYRWPMTQEQMGDATGLTSVHVNRTLRALQSDGLINTGSRMVTIEDWAGLQKAADFDSGYLHQAALAA